MKSLISIARDIRASLAYCNRIWTKRQNAWSGAAMADSVGRGGQQMVQEITGLSSHTLKLGHDQWTGVESVPKDRIRRFGGGRKSITDIYPDIETALLGLVKESPQGDPESP